MRAKVRMVMLLVASACHPAAPSPTPTVPAAALSTDAPAPASTPWRLPIPRGTRLLGRLDIAAMSRGPNLVPFELPRGLLEDCGLGPAAFAGMLEFAVASPKKLAASYDGSMNLEQVACLLGREPPGNGRLELDELVVTELPTGGLEVRNFSPEPASGSARLLPRLEELLEHCDSAVVGELGPDDAPIGVTTFFERSSEGGDVWTLRLELGTPDEASQAARWLAGAVSSASSGEPRLSAVTVHHERRTLTVEIPVQEGMGQLLRGHLVEAYRVPSNSMAPTLVAGEAFFVGKHPEARRPERGDVISFHSPTGPPFVKRVIALSGDRIAVSAAGEVSIDGHPLETVRQADSEGKAVRWGEADNGGEVWEERLGERSYSVVASTSGSEALPELVVPEGHVFVLGDNRNNSHDSRHFGPVATQSIIGSALVIYFSVDDSGVRWDRMGRVLWAGHARSR